jgi:hypothetical protein
MAKESFNLTYDVRAQAKTARNVAETCEISESTKVILQAAAASLESLVRSRERRESALTSNVLEVCVDASTKDIRHARCRRSVRRGKDVFLPSWQDFSFGLPNALIRSAIFSVAPYAEQDKNLALLDVPIAAQGDTVLKLSGHRLYDYDRQVFAAALSYYAEDRPLSAGGESSWVRVSFWQFSKALGITYGPNVHTAIRNSLIRLNAAHLRIRANRRDVPMPHLIEVIFDDDFADEKSSETRSKCSDLIAFRVPEGMAELFGPTGRTAIPSAALTEYSGLPRWIASYYSSHSKPYALAISDLYRYSGADCGLIEFRRRLKKALLKLQEETTADKLRIADFTINKKNDEVTVVLACWNELKIY